MAKNPQRDKPTARAILTGTAQSVTNSVERARGYFKDTPEPTRPPSKQRKNFRTKRVEIDGEQEPTAEREANKPELDGEEEAATED